MKTEVIIFNVFMTNDSIGNLICGIDEALNKENVNHVDIYFSSGGGNSGWSIIVSYINKRKDDITMYFNFEVASTAAIMAMKIRCEIVILDAYMLLHDGDNTFSYKDILRKDTYGVFRLQRLKEENKKLLEEYTEFFKLSKGEVKTIKEGGDVIIPNERVKSIFNALT